MSGPWVEGEEERWREERWREERWREEKWREEDVMGGEMEGRHKFERFCFP